MTQKKFQPFQAMDAERELASILQSVRETCFYSVFKELRAETDYNAELCRELALMIVTWAYVGDRLNNKNERAMRAAYADVMGPDFGGPTSLYHVRYIQQRVHKLGAKAAVLATRTAKSLINPTGTSAPKQ